MSDKTLGIIIITIFIICFIIGLFNTPLFKGSSEDETPECSSCGREYTNSDDVSSIRRTSMCEPCYENFKTTEKMREELKKYEERNR